ncbi:MAG: hypothetical protein J6C56_09135 [Alistipes sp.]|nr:hypothetical protein [Alistipes sp.]
MTKREGFREFQGVSGRIQRVSESFQREFREGGVRFPRCLSVVSVVSDFSQSSLCTLPVILNEVKNLVIGAIVSLLFALADPSTTLRMTKGGAGSFREVSESFQGGFREGGVRFPRCLSAFSGSFQRVFREFSERIQGRLSAFSALSLCCL